MCKIIGKKSGALCIQGYTLVHQFVQVKHMYKKPERCRRITSLKITDIMKEGLIGLSDYMRRQK